MLGKSDVQHLTDAAIASVTVARLEPDDVPEDEAAARIANSLAGDGSASRRRLYRPQQSLCREVPDSWFSIRARSTPSTRSTNRSRSRRLPPFAPVHPGEMIATVKIIPYAAPSHAVEAAAAAARNGRSRVAPYQTNAGGAGFHISGGPEAGAAGEKSRGARRHGSRRWAATSSSSAACRIETEALTEALRGSSTGQAPRFSLSLAPPPSPTGATSFPRRSPRPAARSPHFGMPVDPGNLLLLARLNGVPAIGLPSCARSPKTNGFDFVLQRLFAGPSGHRPKRSDGWVSAGCCRKSRRARNRARRSIPRLRAPRIAAVVLAAGLSSRMGTNKLLQEWRGKPLLRWTVEAALASEARPVSRGHRT